METQKESLEHAAMLIVQRDDHSSKAVLLSRKEEGGIEHEEVQFLPQAQCVLV